MTLRIEIYGHIFDHFGQFGGSIIDRFARQKPRSLDFYNVVYELFKNFLSIVFRY